MKRQIAWWIFFLVSAFYALYALYMGILEALSLLGIVADAPERAVPIIFVMHALAGSVALISGPLQFNQAILRKKRKLHRLLGRAYVWAIWLSSIGGLWSALFFGEYIAERLAFGALAILWFSTATVAFLYIKNRKIKEHREWMIRSFSLSFFFVTFSFWLPTLASTSLPEAIAHPLGVFLSWSINLLVAEIWIRGSRKRISNKLRNIFVFG